MQDNKKITKKITKDQLGYVAGQLGCEVAVLDAVFAVESNGSGFDRRGRPKILFEKHKFYRYLPEGKRKAALKAGLARKSWSKNQYGDQKGYDSRWMLFNAALKIDPDAAIRATSWGIGQLMGFNFALAGYRSPEQMQKAMSLDEYNQLHAVAGFIRSQNMGDAFRFRDWQAIARFYNGSGQVKAYADRMEKAYRASPYRENTLVSGITTMREKALRLGSRGQEVKSLQTVLSQLGYASDVDGDFGRHTEDAVILFQRHNGLKMDGVVGGRTRRRLAMADPLEPNSKPLHEIVRTSRPVQAGMATTVFGGVAGLSGLAGSTPTAVSSPGFLQNLKSVGEVAKTTEQAVRPVGSLTSFVKNHAVLSTAIVAIALGAWVVHRSVTSFRNRNWSF